jgi:hypothetical protein
MFKALTILTTPVLTVHANYAAGDYVGTSGAAMAFALAKNNQRSGTVLSAVLIDYALQSLSTELWLFNAAPTPPNDSAAWSISDADMQKCIGVVPFTTWYASALNSVSFAHGIGLGYYLAASASSLYGCLVTRGAPTYASGDLSVLLHIWQD